MKNKRYNVRVSEKEKEVLESVSEKLDIPASQIIRDAVKEKISELLKTSEAEQLELAA